MLNETDCCEPGLLYSVLNETVLRKLANCNSEKYEQEKAYLQESYKLE